MTKPRPKSRNPKPRPPTSRGRNPARPARPATLPEVVAAMAGLDPDGPEPDGRAPDGRVNLRPWPDLDPLVRESLGLAGVAPEAAAGARLALARTLATNVLHLPAVCARPGCRRARACAGEGEAGPPCLARFAPAPQVRDRLFALHAGLAEHADAIDAAAAVLADCHKAAIAPLREMIGGLLALADRELMREMGAASGSGADRRG